MKSYPSLLAAQAAEAAGERFILVHRVADDDWRGYEPGDEDDLPPVPVASNVPPEVTRRQAKQALLLAGMLGNVQLAIDAIPDAIQRGMVQIEWDDSQVFQRNRPALIGLGTALGLNAAQLDALFVTAAGLP